MEKSGLFNLLQNHLIGSLVDYVTGVETGLDSNGRKNRGGHLMEDLVESFIKKAGFIKDKKAGKSSCGCNCANCAMAGKCHSQTKANKS